LRARFSGCDVEACDPSELGARVKDAVSRGAELVGVAGGDGSIRAAAYELVGTDVPLLAVPAGTRNHFARDVGTGSMDDASAAARDRHVIRIDVGRVNDRVFVNNSSIGLYPKIVQRREVHERRLSKGLAGVVAGWEQLRHGHRVRVDVDGEPHDAWLVFVGNGVYGDGLIDLADRESLEQHVLDLRVVRADRPLARFRAAGAVLLGRLARSPLILRRLSTRCTIDPEPSTVEVALDGEVERMGTPLVYESIPGALAVLTPAPRETSPI
jgi:undecaprenyl-diphosphatase